MRQFVLAQHLGRLVTNGAATGRFESCQGYWDGLRLPVGPQMIRSDGSNPYGLDCCPFATSLALRGKLVDGLCVGR